MTMNNSERLPDRKQFIHAHPRSVNPLQRFSNTINPRIHPDPSNQNNVDDLSWASIGNGSDKEFDLEDLDDTQSTTPDHPPTFFSNAYDGQRQRHALPHRMNPHQQQYNPYKYLITSIIQYNAFVSVIRGLFSFGPPPPALQQTPTGSSRCQLALDDITQQSVENLGVDHRQMRQGGTGGSSSYFEQEPASTSERSAASQLIEKKPPIAGDVDSRKGKKHPRLESVKMVFEVIGETIRVGCCPPIPRIAINKVVFRPPGRSYSFFSTKELIQVTPRNRKKVDMTQPFKIVLKNEDNKQIPNKPLAWIRGHFVERRGGVRLAVAHLPCPGSIFTFLYSHANAMDIGTCIPFMYKVRRKLQCSIVTYDFSGYGLSEGRSGEQNLYSDIEAVLNWVETGLGCDPSRIILFGYSLGTAATVELATRKPKVRAIILVGAFTSILNCLKFAPEKRRSFDIFRTCDRVGQLEHPVLIMHGLNDQITNVRHALWIHENVRNPVPPLFLPDVTHNDILEKPQIWIRLRDFIVNDLNERMPYVALMNDFKRLLYAKVPGLDLKCIKTIKPCANCRKALVQYFFGVHELFSQTDSKILPNDVRNSAFPRVSWDVCPKTNQVNGWQARFTVVSYTSCSPDETRSSLSDTLN